MRVFIFCLFSLTPIVGFSFETLKGSDDSEFFMDALTEIEANSNLPVISFLTFAGFNYNAILTSAQAN